MTNADAVLSARFSAAISSGYAPFERIGRGLLLLVAAIALSIALAGHASANLIVSNLQGETIQGADYSASPDFSGTTFNLPGGVFQAVPSSVSIGDGTKSAAAGTQFYGDDLEADGFTANGGTSISVQNLGDSQTTALCAQDTVSVSMTFQVDQTEAYVIGAGVTLSYTFDSGTSSQGTISYVYLDLVGGGSVFDERTSDDTLSTSEVVTLYPGTNYVLQAATQSEAQIPLATVLPASGLMSGSYNLSLIPASSVPEPSCFMGLLAIAGSFGLKRPNKGRASLE